MVKPDTPIYDRYVRKRRNRRIVTAVGCLCAVGIIVLAIIALLAHKAGAYTVSMKKRGSASLAMSEKSTFEDTRTYLAANNIPRYREYTYKTWKEEEIDNLDSEDFPTPVPEEEDNKETEADEKGTIPYFKYTFFVQNNGTTPAELSVALNMKVVGVSTSKNKDLIPVLRVMLFANRGENLNQHEKTIYALASKDNVDEAGKPLPAKVYYFHNGDIPSDAPDAEPFLSRGKIAQRIEENLQPEEIIRYTFVCWVEGTDPEAKDDPPTNGLALSMSITAKEAKEPEEGTSGGETPVSTGGENQNTQLGQ